MGNFDTMQSEAPQCSTLPRAAHDRLSSLIPFWPKRSMREALVLAAAVASLGAAMQAPAANQQQERMKTCNAQAKSQTLSGSERKSFMERCLSGKDSGSGQGLNSQQQKMKTCNSEANLHGLKGTARQRFMSTCLK